MKIIPKTNSRVLRVDFDCPLEIYLAEQSPDFPEFLKSFLGISDCQLLDPLAPLKHDNSGSYYFLFDLYRDYTPMFAWIQRNARTFSVYQKRELLLKS